MAGQPTQICVIYILPTLQPSDGTDRYKFSRMFDALFIPGTLAPHAGIYRCECCGREIAWDLKRPLPGQGHHEDISPNFDIYWRLTVRASV